MPRKTKKEKVIAEYRRKAQILEVGGKGNGKEASLENRVRVKKPVWKLGEEVSKENTNFLTSKPNRSPHHNLNSNLIKQDLKKTLFLSTLAISLEFVLYWLIELR